MTEIQEKFVRLVEKFERSGFHEELLQLLFYCCFFGNLESSVDALNESIYDF